MAARPKKKHDPRLRWRDAATPADDLDEIEQFAQQIIAEYRDLLPSVERIMSAELDDDGRMQALQAFQASLGSLDDPNRDPRVAIANAGG